MKRITKKQKTQKKYQIALITAVMIGALSIGFTGTLLEREASANISPTIHARKSAKIEPVKGVVKKVAIVDLITNRPDVEVKIREIARAEGFKWPDYLVKLAHCESRLDPRALNDKGNTPSWSKDRGLFQFNSHWQKRVSDACAYSVECSTKTAIKMINAGSQHLWACNDIVLARSN